MIEDTTITFTNPAFRDELRKLAREDAQSIIRQVVEAVSGPFWKTTRASVTRGVFAGKFDEICALQVRVPWRRDRNCARMGWTRPSKNTAVKSQCTSLCPPLLSGLPGDGVRSRSPASRDAGWMF